MPEENMEATESESTDNLELSATEPTETSGYTVKVDGDEHQVSLEELQDGYQRQADYTRKTQELAAERQRLQQAETIVSALESWSTKTNISLGKTRIQPLNVSPTSKPRLPVRRRRKENRRWTEKFTA